jgi:CheY-like chemotaxis protein
LIQYTIPPSIRIETELADELVTVEADFTQMQMVLSAMIANAAEAIDGFGEIRISTSNVSSAEFAEECPGLNSGLCACLTIEDNGKGMDEETRSRIFEPFFTTKFQGRGLGMAAVYGIVRNHNGGIVVLSEGGQGTVVRIYLPAKNVHKEEEEGVMAEVSEGKGTIMVIEDEEPVMEVSRAMLERLGYSILEARNGEEAVNLALNHQGQIDAAILDIVLPDMGGKDVYPLVKKARPDLKVIVSSGFAIDGPAREILDAGAQDFIQKPFNLGTLSGKLKEVLENQATGASS